MRDSDDAGRREAGRAHRVHPLPDDGDVVVEVTETSSDPWGIALRIPAWAVGLATLDGVAVPGAVARVRRTFAAGEVLHLVLPMTPRVVRPDRRIDALRGCIAVERGPLVLCAESVDLPGGVEVDAIAVPSPPRLDVVGERVVLHAELHIGPQEHWPYAATATPLVDVAAPVELPLVPYHSWGNCGPGTMRVWLPTA